jgi:calpain, invertebrate
LTVNHPRQNNFFKTSKLFTALKCWSSSATSSGNSLPGSHRRFTYDGHPIFLLGEEASGLRVQTTVQDFYKIRQQCLESGLLFEDPEFRATNKSLFFSHRPDVQFKWLRPTEICNDPQFFVDGFSRFDVNQGGLGDCWFLAAAVNLTQDMNLFYRVVCEDNLDKYAGIFHFRFWQYGKWVDVVVDDRKSLLKFVESNRSSHN